MDHLFEKMRQCKFGWMDFISKWNLSNNSNNNEEENQPWWKDKDNITQEPSSNYELKGKQKDIVDGVNQNIYVRVQYRNNVVDQILSWGEATLREQLEQG